MSKVGHLQKLHETYGKRGFVMIGIADEEHPKHVAKAMKAKEATYPIGVDVRQRTVDGYATKGVLPLPRFYLVDVDGVVVSSAQREPPTAAQIEAQLERVMLPELDRALHESLASVVADYERDACGLAWKTATKHTTSEDAKVAEDARFLRAKVERYAAWQRERIKKLLKANTHVQAMAELVVFERRFDGMDVADWARKQIGTLLKVKPIHEQRFAWDKLRKAMAKEWRGVESVGKRRSVKLAYRQLIKKYEETRPAKIAAARLEALGE